MWCDFKERLSLVKRLSHQFILSIVKFLPVSNRPRTRNPPQMENKGMYAKSLFKVSHAAMNKLRTPRTRPTGKVIPLHKRNPQTPRRSIQSTPRARSPPANYQDIESLPPGAAFQRCELFSARWDAREGRWIGDCDGHVVVEGPALGGGDGDCGDGKDGGGRERRQRTAAGERGRPAAESVGGRVQAAERVVHRWTEGRACWGGAAILPAFCELRGARRLAVLLEWCLRRLLCLEEMNVFYVFTQCST